MRNCTLGFEGGGGGEKVVWSSPVEGEKKKYRGVGLVLT